jgi:predicted transcriptional regulator
MTGKPVQIASRLSLPTKDMYAEYVLKSDLSKVIEESGLSNRELALGCGLSSSTILKIINRGSTSEYVTFTVADIICTFIGARIPQAYKKTFKDRVPVYTPID